MIMFQKQKIVIFVAIAVLLFSCIGLTPFSVNKAYAIGPWTASTDFSSTQGANQWSYQQRPVGGGAFSDLPTFSSGAWRGGNGNWITGNAAHPDNSYDIVRKWVAPQAGTISITGNVHKNDTGGGNGIVATVQKNASVLWTRTVAFNDSTGYSTDADLGSVTVAAGDAIYFIVGNNGDYTYDHTGWDPTIAYVTAGSWTLSTGFSSTQGQNQWYYQQRPVGGGASTDITFSSGAWRGGGGNWVGAGAMHPDNSNDIVVKWVAPQAGTISITGNVHKNDTGGGNGIVATVQKNASVLWTRTVAFNDGTGYYTDGDLSSVTVAAGDAIYFIVGNNGDYAYDHTGWDPTISYVTAGSWTLSTGFSSTQGVNQWYYQQRPVGGGAFSDIAFSSGAWRGGNGNWLGAGAMHPDNSYDIVAKWAAPQAGTISITGNVHKNDTAGGNGIVATVQKNSTVLWTRTVAYNDGTGYNTDGDLSSVTVAAGDAIYFIVGNNGEYSYDHTGWDPTITYVTGSGPSWNLNTDDTNLTLSIIGNRPAITQLKNPLQNWNWTPASAIVPLPGRVYIGSTAYTPNWSYQGASVDTSSGTKVTLTFASTTPNLALTQVWWARPGVGPVEVTTAVANNTGSSVTYQYTDVISADLTVTADNTTTLNRYDRASYQPGPTGVYKDVMSSSTSVPSGVSNDYNTGPYVLPFEMLDVGGVHGLYMGYNWDFGRILNSTNGNALQIRNQFYLGDSGSVTIAVGKTFNVPGMFFGTYKGDTDDGSNKMKKWFWNYKIPTTMRNNSNEPLVEFDSTEPSFSEAGITSFLANNPLANWGVELLKLDAWWTSDVNTDPPFGWAWNPDPSKWPNGMTAGTIAHNNGLQLALYMGNRYNHVDLATQAGRDAEKNALLTRYDNWHYDYWRSDMEFEPTNDYLSHEGFLEVLDYMIANRGTGTGTFRWENCSAGGSKKSFDLLERQSLATSEDSGSNTVNSVLNFRKMYYSNSFMINAVQLQSANSENISGMGFWLYQLRGGFLGAWLWGGDYSSPDPTTQSQLNQYKSHVNLYKTKQRPILRGADVYHILPMPDGTNWDGIQFFNTSLNKGSVVLFKPNSGVGNSPTIYLKGLNPSATYTLTYQDRGTVLTRTGAQLMAGGTGITVTGTTSDYDSEIIWIN